MRSQSNAHGEVNRLFSPGFAEELATVGRAVDYYERSMPALLSTGLGQRIAGYYQVNAQSSHRLLRFKAFFFATRLQPALDYVAEFVRRSGRPPRLLDVGCGYGLESTLLAVAGRGCDRDRSDGR